MNWSAWSVVFTGLSLTSVTAVVLFVLVAVNPKDVVYGSTPFVYAAGSALAALAFNRASAWAARREKAGSFGTDVADGASVALWPDPPGRGRGP